MMKIKARNIRLGALAVLLVSSTALMLTWPGSAVSSGETAAGNAATGSAAAGAAVNVDPLSVFSARSPGARADGAFLQSKLAYGPNMKSTLGMPINEAIFPQDAAAEEPAVPAAAFAAPQGLEEPVFVDAAQPDSVIAGSGLPGTFSDGFLATGSAGGFAGGGGGGFAGGGGGGIVPPSPPIGPIDEIVGEGAVVPEPGTWLMLIAGFFGIGTAMRAHGRAHGRARGRAHERARGRAGGHFAGVR